METCIRDVHERAIWPSLRKGHCSTMAMTRTSYRMARPTYGWRRALLIEKES